MTAEQPETPLPPEGYATWLDFLAEGDFDARAELAALRAELDQAKADLACLTISGDMLASDSSLFRGNSVRHWYDKAMAYKGAFHERDEAMKKLSDTEGWLATARQQALDLDAQRAEAVRDHNAICSELASVVGREVNLTLDLERVAKDRDEACKERDEARTKLAELREAALELGELDCAYSNGNELYLTWWNSLIAKLRAEQGGEGTHGS